MNLQTAWQLFFSLPPEAQQQVVDFMAFLQTRYPTATTQQPPPGLPELSEEAFLGIWRDRSDMQDSTRWVREQRQREWGEV